MSAKAKDGVAGGEQPERDQPDVATAPRALHGKLRAHPRHELRPRFCATFRAIGALHVGCRSLLRHTRRSQPRPGGRPRWRLCAWAARSGRGSCCRLGCGSRRAGRVQRAAERSISAGVRGADSGHAVGGEKSRSGRWHRSKTLFFPWGACRRRQRRGGAGPPPASLSAKKEDADATGSLNCATRNSGSGRLRGFAKVIRRRSIASDTPQPTLPFRQRRDGLPAPGMRETGARPPIGSEVRRRGISGGRRRLQSSRRPALLGLADTDRPLFLWNTSQSPSG